MLPFETRYRTVEGIGHGHRNQHQGGIHADVRAWLGRGRGLGFGTRLDFDVLPRGEGG